MWKPLRPSCPSAASKHSEQVWAHWADCLLARNYEQSGEDEDKEEMDAAEEAVDKAKEAVELASKPEFKLSVAEAGLAAAKKKVGRVAWSCRCTS